LAANLVPEAENVDYNAATSRLTIYFNQMVMAVHILFCHVVIAVLTYVIAYSVVIFQFLDGFI